MGTKTEEGYGGLWILPVVYYRIRRYFIDLRLRQFREIEDPGNYVEFDSEQGQQICRQCGVVTCLGCKLSVIIPMICKDEELRCMRCFARLLR